MKNELTCDGALAGISCRKCSDPVGGVWDLVSSVLDEDGVPARHVWYIGHQVRPVMVVSDVGLLWLPLRILGVKKHYVRERENCIKMFRFYDSHHVSTHSDLHGKQSFAGVFGINCKLNWQ